MIERNALKIKKVMKSFFSMIKANYNSPLTHKTKKRSHTDYS